MKKGLHIQTLGKRFRQVIFSCALGALSLAFSSQAALADHFVFVHGSWHGAWCWYHVQTLLEKEGHEVTAVELPAHGIDQTLPETVQLQDYTDAVTAVLDNIPGPVILVGHSLGGIVISEVAEARPSKVEKLVYLAAFLVPNGNALLDFALQDVNSLAGQNLVPVDLTGDGIPDALDITPSVTAEAFYNRSPDEDITLARSLFVLDPFAPVVTQLSLGANYESVRRFYISTLQDQALTPTIQALMYTLTPVEEVFSMNADHSPFFSKPQQLQDILTTIASR